jgi:hypothetical protein
MRSRRLAEVSAPPLNRNVMPHANGIALFAIMVAVSGCVEQETAIAMCESDLQPTVRVAPELPPILHNEYEGHAKLEYVVAANGDVRDARIVSAEWQPVGNTRGEPRGYDEAILEAVGDWKYPPVGRPCVATTRITFLVED